MCSVNSSCYKYTCVWMQVFFSFDTHCRSHQKMWLHIRRRLVVPGNVRRSSRMSHRVWQLKHYLVDYKWWILLKPEYCLLKAVAGKEMGKRTFQKLSHYMRRRAMSHNVRQLPREIGGESHQRGVCLCSLIHVCMCVCVCVCVCMCVWLVWIQITSQTNK